MTTWLTFIGGKYTPESFVNEAEKFGITRRISGQEAKRMAFGDTVYLCYQPRGEDAYAFGTMVVASVVLDGVLGELVTDALGAFGHAERVNGDPILVERECGSFTLAGAVSITCDLEHVVETAQYIAKVGGLDEWYMVGGYLTGVYPEEGRPAISQWAATKKRGFTECAISEETTEVNPHILLIKDYKQV